MLGFPYRTASFLKLVLLKNLFSSADATGLKDSAIVIGFYLESRQKFTVD